MIFCKVHFSEYRQSWIHLSKVSASECPGTIVHQKSVNLETVLQTPTLMQKIELKAPHYAKFALVKFSNNKIEVDSSEACQWTPLEMKKVHLLLPFTCSSFQKVWVKTSVLAQGKESLVSPLTLMLTRHPRTGAPFCSLGFLSLQTSSRSNVMFRHLFCRRYFFHDYWIKKHVYWICLIVVIHCFLF